MNSRANSRTTGATLLNGTIVPIESPSYSPPEVSQNLAVKTNFIPFEFAHGKVKSLEQDCKNIKDQYEQRLEKVNGYYKTTIDGLKKHYEVCIFDIKDKAKQQIELNAIKIKVFENNKKKEINMYENEIEDLKNESLEKSKFHKNEIQSLSVKLASIEKDRLAKIEDFTSKLTRLECQYVLTDISFQIELSNMDNIHSMDDQRLASVHLQMNDLKHAYERLIVEKDISLHSYRESTDIRRDCFDSLTSIMQKLETKDMNKLQRDYKITMNELKDISTHLHDYESANICSSIILEIIESVENLGILKRAEKLEMSLVNLQERMQIHAGEENSRLECSLILSNIVEKVEAYHWNDLAANVNICKKSKDKYTRAVKRNLKNSQIKDKCSDVLMGIVSTIEVREWVKFQKSVETTNKHMTSVQNELTLLNDRKVCSEVLADILKNAEINSATELININENTKINVIHSNEVKTGKFHGVEMKNNKICSDVLMSIISSIEMNSWEELRNDVNSFSKKAKAIVEQSQLRKNLIINSSKLNQSDPMHESKDHIISVISETSVLNNENIGDIDLLLSTAGTESFVSSSTPITKYVNVIRPPMMDAETMTESRIKREMSISQSSFSSLNRSSSMRDLKVDMKILEVSLAVSGNGGNPLIPALNESADVPVDLLDVPVASNPDDIATIEHLEDEIFEMKQELQNLHSERENIESEKQILQQQVESLINTKRTDIVKKYMEDIESLNQLKKDQSEEIVSLKTEKLKLDTKLKEFTDRVTAAEKELKDRDTAELAKLSTAEEKAQLKTTINKQRADLIMKTKAVTAGWDAAADADEKLEIQVERAYNKGFSEGQGEHDAVMASLNNSIEEKENKLTEMLVSIHAMEFKVRESEKLQLQYQQEMEQVKQEAADTVLLFSSMAGSNSEGGVSAMSLGPSESEFEAVKDMLETAQDEVVDLTEQAEKLQNKVYLCEQQISIYEQLLSSTKMHEQQAPSHPVAAVNTNFLPEIITAVKAAISKGTNLWKANKREEAYDLYNSTVVNASIKLVSKELKQPFLDALSQIKTQVTSQAAKGKGAVILRKTLDKFMVDSQDASYQKTEETANNDLKPVFAISEDEQQYINDVHGLETQLAVLESLYKNEGSAAKSQSHAAAENGDKNDSTAKESIEPTTAKASSLLKRAKAAETSVDKLKKQIAFILTATGASDQQSDTSSGEGTSNPAPLAGDESQKVDYISEDGAEISDRPSGSGNTVGVGGTMNPQVKSATIPLKKPVVAAKAGSAGGGGGGGGGGADPAEVRKLQRRVKELEAQILVKTNAESSDSNGNAAAEKKALAVAEKQLQKKIKDLETSFKKEKGSLETRAIKSEKALEAANALLEPITKERDQLRGKVKDVNAMTEELGNLRKQSEKFIETSKSLEERTRELEVISDQYKKETALRKKYKNELEDIKGAIRVYARCRPFAKYEIERGCKSVVQFKEETTLKVATSRGEKEWEFDCAFGMDSTQQQVFEDAQRLVESCLDGFNVCIFAYGQTGSGKTFTMTGSPDLPGLTPRAITEIFALINGRGHCTCKVSTYFVELYNDNLVDLFWILDNKKAVRNIDGSMVEPPHLDIKLNKQKMVFINNAVVKEARDPEELMALFMAGNGERHVGATKMNAESSRSHSIFSIMVESYDSATKRTTIGKLSLVDLAGSERADKTGAQAERLKEAQSINKSLSALGDVIAALSEGEKFIPYRNNKLTQLMQDSLGGNAKTLMFVNFSPADYNVDETVSSLGYAARVKKIVNNASKQAESEEVARLKAIIKRLQSGQAVQSDEVLDVQETAGDADS